MPEEHRDRSVRDVTAALRSQIVISEMDVKEGPVPGRSLIPKERIEGAIVILRGQRVMIDATLSELYEVEIRTLNQAVKRNAERFPSDFMFQLTADEAKRLRSQIVILETGRGRYRKYLPFAFTEQGVAMLSSVLRSPRAVRANIEIMRAFVRLRRMLASNALLAKRLDEIEKRYDGQFKVVFEAIRNLMSPPATPRRRIGFSREEGEPTRGRGGSPMKGRNGSVA